MIVSDVEEWTVSLFYLCFEDLLNCVTTCVVLHIGDRFGKYAIVAVGVCNKVVLALASFYLAGSVFVVPV